MESNLENNSVPNLLMPQEDLNLQPIIENYNPTKLEIANEIYILLDDSIKQEIENLYKEQNQSNDLVHPETIIEAYSDVLKNAISFDIKKYNDMYKLYKYIKDGKFYYITFDVTTKKYYKLLSRIENIDDIDIMNTSEVLFESQIWKEMVENVINN